MAASIKKDVIRDERTKRIYWDSGIIRNFESVLCRNITSEKAQEKYPEIILLD